MAKLERIIEARRSRAAFYDSLLQGSGIVTPVAIDGSRHVYQTYVVLLPGECASRRSEMIGRLRDQGVECTIGTYHMPLLTYYRETGRYKPGDFPVTDDVAARSLALPLHERLGEEEQRHVISVLLREIQSI